MLLGKMMLTESAKLEFAVDVFGTTEKISDIRFVIEGLEYDIVCKCTENNGSIVVDVPKLNGVMTAGIYEARLEVIIEGRIFIPLRESIEFVPLIEMNIEQRKPPVIKESNVEVKVIYNQILDDIKPLKEEKVIDEVIENIGAAKQTKLEMLISEATQKGFERMKNNNFKVLKKDNSRLNKKFFQNTLLLKNLHGSDDYFIVATEAAERGFPLDSNTFVIQSDLDNKLFTDIKNNIDFKRIESNIFQSNDGVFLEIYVPRSRTSYLVYSKDSSLSEAAPIKKGDHVEILKAYQDDGDDKFTWVAADDEEKGRVTITPIDSPLRIKPTYVVKTNQIKFIKRGK